MDLDNIISGRLPISLPHLENLVLRIPTKMDIIKNQRVIDSFCKGMLDEYRKAGHNYHEIDAEKELLETYPDFYEIMDASEKKKKDIILSLDVSETPDERFMKTPEEVDSLPAEEKEKYLEYVKKQYSGFYDKLLADKTIKKATEYMEVKALLYSKTVEHSLKESRRIYWLVVTAEDTEGNPYFKDDDTGFKTILGLPYPEYTQLLDIWNGVLDGFGLPF